MIFIMISSVYIYESQNLGSYVIVTAKRKIHLGKGGKKRKKISNHNYNINNDLKYTYFSNSKFSLFFNRDSDFLFFSFLF